MYRFIFTHIPPPHVFGTDISFYLLFPNIMHAQVTCVKRHVITPSNCHLLPPPSQGLHNILMTVNLIEPNSEFLWGSQSIRHYHSGAFYLATPETIMSYMHDTFLSIITWPIVAEFGKSLRAIIFQNEHIGYVYEMTYHLSSLRGVATISTQMSRLCDAGHNRL